MIQLPLVGCVVHMAPATVRADSCVSSTNCMMVSSIKNGCDVQRYLNTPGNKGLFFVLAAASPGQLNTMGSFNSAPKILNEDNQDNDLDLPEKMTHEDLLAHCRKNLEDTPLVNRNFLNFRTTYSEKSPSPPSKIRILQWNLLSQALGQTVDHFVACPDSALDWRRRRQQLSEEIIRYEPDIVCLQEVDHYNYFQKTLSTQGFKGIFFPKPDSPCIYIKDNNGPDGCAIFFREDKFELVLSANRILEVWRVQSNQVAVLAILREHSTGQEICVATTHLKARSGALLSTLRNEQGKDLLEFVTSHASGRPVLLCGDFNAEPSEPIYSTVLNNDLLGLASAYKYQTGHEPPYTTWKIREDGEVRHTIDYIFYSQDKFQIDGILQFPTGEEIGEGRVPSLRYPSDHFSLVCDLTLINEKVEPNSIIISNNNDNNNKNCSL
ncbi:NADP/NADPH phosphatase nocturnin isoform X1 [Lycorma delicatula]|uniref:NADP/NADPH phosphatase nocturnin isoform X1 n=1 Tax=Lycorma delicatula TaxID=130591 RepID=UPI003F516A46